jgi:Flp pilus assembly protein TadG
MMMRHFSRILRNERGAAGAEMALMVPLLVTLMFGSFELGHYFWSEHKVIKGVRDAARFAGRQPFSSYSCSAVTATGLETKIQNLARTGQITGGTPRIALWDDVEVKVTIDCDSTTQTGIYKGLAGGAKRVTVSTNPADPLEYQSLFKALGFVSYDMTLHASAQTAVMGI